MALAVPVGVLATLLCLAVTGQAGPADPGLPDAGALVRVGLPAARTLQDLASALTIGLLVLAACVLPPGEPGADDVLVGTRARAVRLAAASAAAWVLAGATTLVLTYADVAGLSPRAPGFTSQLGFFLRSFDLGRAMSASLLLASCVCIGALLTTRLTTVGWLALLALGALLPLALAGHAAGSDDHQAAVDSLGLHLLGVSVWVGGLAGLVLLSPTLRQTLRVTTRRYSTLAGWCFLLVAASGTLNAWVRLGSLSGLRTAYGSLVLVKATALVALGVAGWWHRRTTLPRLDAGSGRRAFLRLGVVEVVVMGATVGVAVALSRSAPPVAQRAVGTVPDTASALLGYPTPPELTLSRWVTSWYVEPAWAALAVLGLIGYLVAVGRLRRSGGAWPWSRSAVWAAGCAALLWATSGAPGVYGRTQLSAHVVQHMTLIMVVPMLLVMGAPATLALRTLPARDDGSRGPREWLNLALRSRALAASTRPILAATAFVVGVLAASTSATLDVSLSTHAGHMLATTLYVVAGYLFAWVLMGRDPLPARAGYPTKAVLLGLTAAAQAFVAVRVLASSRVLAEEWFRSVGGRTGAALAADQRAGAEVALLLGLALTMVMAGLVGHQWWTADRAVRTAADDPPDAPLVSIDLGQPAGLP